MRLWHQIENLFEVDKRALKVYRIVIGLVLLEESLIRLSDATAFYSDNGVLPLIALESIHPYPWDWSVLLLSNNKLLLFSLFACLIASSLCIIVGRFTKAAMLVSWIGLVSLQNRNPIIYQGGDDLLRMMVFWSFFIPWSRVEKNVGSKQLLSFATTFLILQLLGSFFFSAFFKGTYEWWYQGSALFYALSLDQLTRPAGLFLVKQYELTVFLTRMAYLGEFLVLPIFLIPFARTYVRGVVFLFVFTFSITTFTFMVIGVFPLCFLAGSILILPSSFWSWVWPVKTEPELDPLNEEDSFSLVEFGTNFFLIFSFMLVLIWNIQSLPSRWLFFPNALNPIVHLLKLTQSWGMFSPTVLKEDGWLIAEARLENGERIDLMASDQKLSFLKPPYVLDRIKNDRWRKYTEQIVIPGNKRFLPEFANYLLYNYGNTNHDKSHQIKDLKIIHMLELSKPYPYTPFLEKSLLFETSTTKSN